MNLHFYNIALGYTKACKEVSGMVKTSRYKILNLIEGLNLSRATFYRKLKDGDWQPTELEKLSYLLDGKEVPQSIQKA